MTARLCPNGWEDRPTCTHPMCPVHKDEATRQRNAEEWGQLISDMRSDTVPTCRRSTYGCPVDHQGEDEPCQTL